MLCKIAGLLTEVPSAGGLASRCQDYICPDDGAPEIVICENAYRRKKYAPCVGEAGIAYMESACQFYRKLVEFDGFYLHSSAVVLDGKAYLFSGHSGVGKSTHTRLWKTVFGPNARVINDDKPAIRLVNGQWIVYGTPWCGKDGINENISAPLAGVCFMKQAQNNKIRRMDSLEAMTNILTQTMNKFRESYELDRLLKLLDRFLADIPVYELENRPEPAAAQLSHETMRRCAEENGL